MDPKNRLTFGRRDSLTHYVGNYKFDQINAFCEIGNISGTRH